MLYAFIIQVAGVLHLRRVDRVERLLTSASHEERGDAQRYRHAARFAMSPLGGLLRP
jgi:hypothetical protein